MFEKFRPLYDRVLIERIETENEKSAGGIIIPDAAKEKGQTGKVIAVGEGRVIPDGKIVPLRSGRRYGIFWQICRYRSW